MERPTDNLKRHEIKTRIGDETHGTLNDYREEKGTSKTKGIRDGIRRLELDITKK